ncbi:hypothetical protein PPL_05823 [Heterostelium album PN500]|uniref:Pesticidal crystal protein domain-containing protein n=1 Tax=Heterostelium pallidum (strain ATCC 26659 / Pp 5 / PN500) TaxID=670386 RepID=D3BBF5_HETP5|nr:hypothetical protein PPL_05823 [Heterostelium album PN500]EFA80988.1 hypothetical protein PPL_05823 [Heterostelium album PN500]|eukprot:XP_020433106.1 hypothetical protein PPL_05823 [Heterostelium album PN500]
MPSVIDKFLSDDVIANPDLFQQQKKVISDLTGQTTDTMDDAIEIFKSLQDLLQQKTDIEAAILKTTTPDIAKLITLKMRIENVHAHTIGLQSQFLKANYECVNLPIYTVFASLHLLYMYDIINRSTFYGLDNPMKAHYLNFYKRFKKDYFSNIFKVYSNGQNKVLAKFPEKQLEKCNYHLTFNKYQEYRNNTMLNVYQYVHIFANLRADYTELVDRGFNYVNPRPLFSRMVAKTVAPLITKKQGTANVINPEAMGSFRMELPFILKKMEDGLANFYFQDVWRIWMTVDDERINSIQSQYLQMPLSTARLSAVTGTEKGTKVNLVGPLKNQLIFNDRDEDDDDRIKFIGLGADNRVGPTKYLPKSIPSEKIIFENHKISQVVGINRTPFRTVAKELDPGVYGLVLAFVPDTLEPNYMDVTKTNIISAMCLDAPPTNYVLQQNHNNILGMDAILLKVGGTALFSFKSKIPYEFTLYTECYADADAQFTFYKEGDKAQVFSIPAGHRVTKCSTQIIQADTKRFQFRVNKGPIILKSIYLIPKYFN